MSLVSLLRYLRKINLEKNELQRRYGEELSPSKVRTIELVKQLLNIIIKTNGFALGSIKKGFLKPMKVK